MKCLAPDMRFLSDFLKFGRALGGIHNSTFISLTDLVVRLKSTMHGFRLYFSWVLPNRRDRIHAFNFLGFCNFNPFIRE